MISWIRDHKKLSALAAVLAVVLAVAAAVMLTPKGEVTSFTPEFETAQSQALSEGGSENGIRIPGYTVIPIRAGETEVEIDLNNPQENKVYFQITFLLGKEQIYQSKLIKPGDHLYHITLQRPLEAGDYDLTIQYDTFSMDGEYTPRNGASVSCTLRAA